MAFTSPLESTLFHACYIYIYLHIVRIYDYRLSNIYIILRLLVHLSHVIDHLISREGKLFGKEVTFKRYQQAFGADYAFSGQVARAQPLEASPEVSQVLNRLRELLVASELKHQVYGACHLEALKEDELRPLLFHSSSWILLDFW